MLTLLSGQLYVSAQTLYVWPESPTPTPPYTNWDTAAHDLQEAIDAAVEGDTVLVTNGVYATGGRALAGIMTNRVVIDKAIRVQSIGGPEVTIIQGYQLPGWTNGVGAIRCVYLASGAVIDGFTLTGGATVRTGSDYIREQTGGGVLCQSINAQVLNCIISSNSAYSGGGAYSGTLSNCTLFANTAVEMGGGAGAGTLRQSLVSHNSARTGGGVQAAVMEQCTLSGNFSQQNGGGAADSTLRNCTVSTNSAGGSGGGGANLTASGCTFANNVAAENGGGAYSSSLKACLIYANTAVLSGGGAYYSTLVNCTVTSNAAEETGGGAAFTDVANSIVFYNTASREGDNYFAASLNYCNTTPLPVNGAGNISTNPALASLSHLSATSDCRGAGSALYTANSTDIDGESWGSPPAIGCDEFWAGNLTGPLSVSIQATYSNLAAGFAGTFRAEVGGRCSRSQWDFGNGVVLSNEAYISYAWTQPGAYNLILTAYNDSAPEGVSYSTLVVIEPQPIHYVSAASLNPLAPYESWETAARTIQEAVDVAVPGAIVRVTNGVYQTGGRRLVEATTNRVAINRPVRVESVNGPANTTIVGWQVPTSITGTGAVRCAYVGSGAILSGFTVTQGATSASAGGGGVLCQSRRSSVTNCIITGNVAHFGGGACYGMYTNCILASNKAQNGAGGYYATLVDCVLSNNAAENFGGGLHFGTLLQSTLVGNSAPYGGGAYEVALDHCNLMRNSADYGGGAFNGSLTDCILSENVAIFGGGSYAVGASTSTFSRNTSYQGGGGAAYGSLNNCTLSENFAFESGGGTYESTLYQSRLTENSAHSYGGGAYGGTLNQCTVNSNSASFGGGISLSRADACILAANSAASYGGAADWSTLRNCVVRDNWAGSFGGGVYSGTLTNCTVLGNWAGSLGGGSYQASLYNTINHENLSGRQAPNYYGGTLNYCCTVPLPSLGEGNISETPQFVDLPSRNLRPVSTSPCVNAGFNAYTAGPVDLDGRSRINGGTVDIGAYEMQTAVSLQYLAWLESYGLPRDGSADLADPDGDSVSNMDEYMADTCPLVPNTPFQIEGIKMRSPGTISFTGSTNRTYTLFFCTNFVDPSSILTWLPVPGAMSIQGTGSQQTLDVPNTSGQRMFRLRIDEPAW